MRGPRQSVRVRAPGKINVFFEVGDVAPDGYHPVASVYQALSLYEEVTARPASDFTIAVTGDVDVSGVPLDASNLAVRAARLVAQHLEWEGGVHLDIHKGVPVAGGMGGGSADAAAALVAVNELLDGGLTPLELQELGAELGADVPFAVLGGTAIGTGRGDELAPALARGRFDWVLVTSEDGLSTPAVYGELDRLRALPDIAPSRGLPQADPAVLQALRSGDAAALAPAIRNDLQEAALSLRPALADVLARGIDAGALAGLVSGSGPTIAFLTPDAAASDRIVATLTGAGHTALAAHGPVPGARVLDT
ncbi:MAG: 4-(cytidine 5'-diphospho)-2-C-methyl-D-erythritol kinase [Microbacterium sp.]|uniref:4-(cytidine 5'-diphospho)-2-C-methyl-D-erythritol kinase n=1 Tax=Microbacterium sp. TaxID=51671 RepID=UPI001AC56B71|nr:4-(cytidine 5'-diphospho)-2-C-methyl-D-erythritol kinase [Microbacterium sp.]MBN9175865.1 4-(cytidine 5'-diphospho)-2-C-methyl-D-erythritol kinase [Microbacterium sp.]